NVTRSVTIESGGSAISMTLLSSTELVRDGGTDVSATLSGSFQDVFGVASEATIDFGDSQLIESGGLAISTMILSGGIETVGAGGLLLVESGGGVQDTIVSAGGHVIVSAGGVESGAIITGVLEVFGSAVFDDVLSGGLEFVGSGGSADIVCIENGGRQTIQSGGRATSTFISSGGSSIISSGG